MKSVNTLLAGMLPVQPPEALGAAVFGNSIVSNVTPSGGQVPIGSAVADLGNKNGNKFTRGWLAGHGGSEIESALGSLAFDVRPAPYNNRMAANFRAVVTAYGAPVAGLSNLDVNAPGRTWAPLNEARAEFVPSTWSTASWGLDIVSGNVGPTVFAAANDMIGAPTSQFYQFGQVREGGDARPSYPSASERPEGAKSNGFGLKGAARNRAMRGNF